MESPWPKVVKAVENKCEMVQDKKVIWYCLPAEIWRICYAHDST